MRRLKKTIVIIVFFFTSFHQITKFHEFPYNDLNYLFTFYFNPSKKWMDGLARLEDGCPQVPGATCYQDNILFMVVLQGSAATALSPSDLSIIQPAHKCTASAMQV